jgi:catechol 2,3-dioxygenase-like lactoylglutathione lyase family enzyme
MKFDQHITFLPCSDLERSHAFYAGVLGLELTLDQGTCRIYGVGGNAFVGVCERDEVADLTGLMVTLVTDEVDAWYKRLVEAGVDVDEPKFNPRYNIYHLFVRDPDGHVVEIQRFDDPRWNRADTEGGRH